MRRAGRKGALLALAVVAAVSCSAERAQSPQPQASPEPTSHDATSHEAFTGIGRWTRIFDDPKRDEWQKPKELVDALGVGAGKVVADLGAGTGYFEKYLAKKVTSKGMVLAIDTEPEMVRHLAERALKEGTLNVLPILALPQEPFLPPGRVDCVLIVDTYHHIDDRIHYFRRVGDTLAPGGRVAVVDFHKKPLPVGPPVEHKLTREFVIDEMKQAGYRLDDEKTFLPYQYFLLFRFETH